MTEENKSRSFKKFSDYYADTEWKLKHLKYMCERIKCECGCISTRSNMTRHKRGKVHRNNIQQNNTV